MTHGRSVLGSGGGAGWLGSVMLPRRTVLLACVRPSGMALWPRRPVCVFVLGRMDCCNVWVVERTTYRLFASLLVVMIDGCVVMFGVEMHGSVVRG
jgi:hypothetical protein